MNDRKTLLDSEPLAHCSLKDFLDALASDAMIPGAGAAGGIALALAAACAGKAAAISRRHAEESLLEELEEQLNVLRTKAISLAEADALLFKEHLRQVDNTAGENLRRTDQLIVAGCQELDALLDANRDQIVDTMEGDWQAAKALCLAAKLIQEMNLRELSNNEAGTAD